MPKQAESVHEFLERHQIDRIFHKKNLPNALIMEKYILIQMVSLLIRLQIPIGRKFGIYQYL